MPEFLKQLQLTTSFPVRPFVLTFLQSNVHMLREEVQRWVVFMIIKKQQLLIFLHDGKMIFIQISDLFFIKIDRNECLKQLVNYL